jgi:hypothetical protein
MSFAFLGFGRFCLVYLRIEIVKNCQGKPSSKALPVHYSVVLVHHPQNRRLIRRVDWRYGNIPHRSEFTAIVQMLVLEAEEVPNESSEDFQRSEDRCHQVTTDDLVLRQQER